MTANISRRLLLAGSAAALGGVTLGVPARSALGQRAISTGGGALIRLIANENAYGPSPAAREALSASIDDCWKYAFRQSTGLKTLIAEREGVDREQIMIGAGSAEILRIAALVFGKGGGEVIAARPTFNLLPTYASTIGCMVREVSLDDEMRHDLDGMASAIGADSKLMYVCNPNNPTGTRVEGGVLRAFLGEVAGKIPVLVDEAYLDLSDDLPEHTAVPSVLAGDRVIVTRTFSKLHGLAGVRIGYSIASPEITQQLEAHRMTVLNLPGLRAATASYTDLEFQRLSRAQIQKAMSIATELFDELGRPYVPSYGNFVFFDTGGSPEDFSAAMRRRGIMTGLSFAPYETWARVSMGTVEHMQVFARAAREYFQA